MGGNFLKDFSAHVAGTKSDKYNEGQIEVVDFIEDKLSLKDYALGCAVKYIVRYTATGQKNGNKVDLLKAAHYLMMVYERDVSETQPGHTSPIEECMHPNCVEDRRRM